MKRFHEPLLLRPDDVAAALGSAQLARQVIAAGWLTPVVRRHKLTLYDRADVIRAYARITAGEFPTGQPRKTPSNRERSK